MEIFYVSALFLPEEGDPYRSLDKYIEYFKELASCRISLGIYLDPRLRSLGEHLTSLYKNLIILDYIPVDKSYLPTTVTLPPHRNETKDTVDYMCIQLMKLKLLAKASQDTRITCPALAWIDFGIFHMFRNKEMCRHRLETLRLTNSTHILNPGAWPSGNYSLFHGVVWRYCGSFLLGERSLFLRAASDQDALVRTHLPHLTWEVNYWTHMDCFEWYKADHNDSILDALFTS